MSNLLDLKSLHAIVAKEIENDLIQYNGSAWVVHFDSSESDGPTYIQNNFTGEQFKWDGTEWANSYQGRYYPGFWRIVN